MRELILVMIVLLIAFTGVMIALLRIETKEDRMEEGEIDDRK